MTKIGLTVGKYAPFHKGHQYLIETALNEMDSLIVIVYDAPKYTDIPLNIRANWIRQLYPQVTVIEGWEVPREEGWSEENQRKHEDFIKSFIKDIKITAFYSSENYGERMSQSLRCQNRIVDMERHAIRISATDIRKDAYGFKAFLDPIVYSDYITKVYLFGHDKTELTMALANAYRTTSVLDVEKEYRAIHSKYETLTDLEYTELAITQNQQFKLKNYDAHRYLFIDSDLIEMQVNYRNTHHKNNPVIDSLISQNRTQYDLIFISQDEEHVSDEFQLISELDSLKIPYRFLKGSLDSKLQQIHPILKTYRKYERPYFLINNTDKYMDFVLETERLYLRRLKPSDFESLRKIMQDPVVMVAYEHAFSDSEIKDWLLKQLQRYELHDVGLWAVVLKETDEVIGQCGITLQNVGSKEVYEIGYLFQKAYWHLGYATEAAIGCKKYAFEVMGLEEVVSIIRDTNIPSQNVAIRNGMKITDQFIKHYQSIDMPHNVYSVKRNNYTNG